MRRILALVAALSVAGCSSNSGVSYAPSGASGTSTGSGCTSNCPQGSASFTINGMNPCDPLNPAASTPSASHSGGTSIQISVGCKSGGGSVSAVFAPTPSPGGTAPCVQLQANGSSSSVFCSQGDQKDLSGQVTVNGTVGAYTIDGSCTCTKSTSPSGTAAINFNGVHLN